MKKIVYVIVGLLVLAAGAVLALPGIIDWNDYRNELADAMREATGRNVAIEGDLRLSILPRPALSVAGVKIGNLQGAKADNMLELERLDVNVRLGPLLSGRIEVDSVRLVQPVIILEKLADGRANWVFEPAAGPAAEATGGANDAGGSDGTGELQLSLDRFEVSQGKVIYRDAQSGTEETVEELELSGSAVSMLGPFDLAGRTRIKGLPVFFELSMGRLERTRPTTLKLTLRGEQDLFALTYQGRIDDPLGAPQLSGDLTASAADLAAALAEGGVTLPAFASRKLDFKSRLLASDKDLSLNNAQLSLGDLSAGGALNVAFAEALSFDVALDVKRLDLDKLLRDLAASSPGGKSAKSGGAAGNGGDDAGVMVIPDNIKGSVSLAIDGVAFKGGLIRQVNLQAAIDKGKVELSRVSAQLPGGSDFSLSGKAANSDQGPRFAGRIDVLADNLRGLLAWAGFDAASLPSGRLSNLQASARITATPSLVEVSGDDIRIDNTKASVAAAVRLQARPSFGLSVTLDKLNLDGYAALAGAKGDAKGAAGKTASQPAKAKSAPPLAPLNDFDANVSFAAQQLSYDNVRIRGLTLGASLIAGKLSISEFKVADLAGASLALSGSAEGFAAVPSIDVKLQAAAKDLTGLARLAGVEMPIPPARLRQAKLSAHIVGNADAATVKANASAAGATVDLDGSARGLLDKPSADLKYRLRHASLAQLAKLLGMELNPIKGNDSPVDLAGSFRGDANAFDIDLKGSLAQAVLTAKGRIEPGATPMALDVAVDLAAKDAVKSLRGVGIDYRPSTGAVGGLKLTGKLKGSTDQAAISDLVVAAGPLDVRGQGALRLGGGRPFVQAKLTGGDILLDPLLPGDGAAEATGAGKTQRQQGGKKRGRWSRERIDLSALNSLDAELDVTAKSIVFQRYPFVEPRLRLILNNGVLKVEELSGKLFKGQVGLSATLDASRTPKLDLAVKLDDADIHEALKTALQLDQVSGLMSFQGTFKTAGGSQWELVNGLSGQAKMAARDGAVQGFDMKKFSARLGRLNKTPDFLNLVNISFSGGQTRLHRASGTWQVARGVARTKDTRADLDAAAASLTGNINLPAWRMDLKTVLRLIEHKNAPDVGAHVYGPLDAPKRDLKTRDLERWLIARAGKEVLLKTLGKEKAGGAGAILDALTGTKSGSSTSGTSSGGIIRRRSTDTSQPIQRRRTVPQQQQPQQPRPSTTEDAATTILRNLLKKK